MKVATRPHHSEAMDSESQPVSKPGQIVVISGPSGAGKTTLLRRLSECCLQPFEHSVSATTRPPRPGEIDGVDYHFLSHEEFAQRRAAGEFLECCEVFGRGDWYGTLRKEVAPRLAAGSNGTTAS